MLKAFYAVAGPENVEKVIVDFSIGKGFFVEARGSFTLNQELLDQVKAKMQEYVDQEIPILKRSISTDDAIERFHKHRMYDKERLFLYRRVSRVNVYSIDGFEDYFYGYMVPNTKYIRYFNLKLYEYGFVLMLPSMLAPTVLPEFAPLPKLFHTLADSSEWGKRLDLETVGALNDKIAAGRYVPFDPDPGGASGETDRRDRGPDRRAQNCQDRYDRRSFFLWKDNIFPSVVRTVGGYWLKAASNRGR